MSHKIVVVGGGAGGLELVTRLGDSLGRRGIAQITLVDAARTHLWKPLLHAVAAGSLDVDDHELDYLAQAHWHHFSYRIGELIALDRAAKTITLAASRDEDGFEVTPERQIPYDTLVIAIGSVSHDFGTPGVREHAFSLDSLHGAERFNRRLVNAFIRAHAQKEPVRPGQLHVAIIGAGATGTELSAELHRTTRQLVAYGLDRIDIERDLKITLIEAAPRILPALPERISRETEKLLGELEVEVRPGARVAQVRADGVILADQTFIPAELTVWAAGVRGPDVLASLDGLEVNRANQLVVTQTLQTTRDPDIFAFGDCAACPRPGHAQPVPPRAQAAHQEASYMLRLLRRRLKGETIAPYIYRDFGSLVSLGEYTTIGNLMGFLANRSMMIEGYFARLMYRSLYKMHEYALYGPVKVILTTAARSLNRRAEPTVKLH